MVCRLKHPINVGLQRWLWSLGDWAVQGESSRGHGQQTWVWGSLIGFNIVKGERRVGLKPRINLGLQRWFRSLSDQAVQDESFQAHGQHTWGYGIDSEALVIEQTRAKALKLTGTHLSMKEYTRVQSCRRRKDGWSQTVQKLFSLFGKYKVNLAGWVALMSLSLTSLSLEGRGMSDQVYCWVESINKSINQ